MFVDNDATVAALAEAFDDAGRPIVQNLVMFTVGTGIGGGLVLNGRVYRGATGAAGELGHTLVGVDVAGGVPRAGDFPQPGSLESLAAGRVLDRLAAQIADRSPSSALGKLAAEGTGGRRGRRGGGGARPAIPRRSRRCERSESASGSGSRTRSTPSIPTRS